MSPIGREEELASLGSLLDSPPTAPRVVVLEGAPGVGKTSLWECGLAIAQPRARVLVAHGSEAIVVPFGGVVDLMSGVARPELAGVPEPQLDALEVALYRAAPGDLAPASSVLALATLSALRVLAEAGPLVVAVDDVQWLDRQSTDALAYAAKRLRHEPVTFLLTRRGGRASAVETAASHADVVRLGLEPLSLGAVRQVLLTRLGLRLPHHLLRRIYEMTGGNPLFAIEVGRLLASRDLPTAAEELPVPADVEALLGLRVDDLAPGVRRVLMAASFAADPTVDQVRHVGGRRAFDDAVSEGVVDVRRGHVRAAHPLLAAAARRRADDDERASVHQALAAVTASEEVRVLHLALASSGPDDHLAERLSSAADLAAARGATTLAVELSTHAVRLTPPDGTTDARVLSLARHLHDAGERSRVTDLLAERADHLPTPADRVSAHLLLAGGLVDSVEDMRDRFDRALAAAGDDPVLRGRVLANVAVNDAVVAVRDVARADDVAAAALTATVGGGAELERFAVYAYCWTRALRGRPVDDLVSRYDDVQGGPVYLTRHPRRVVGQRHVWRGEVAQARAALSAYRELADARAQASAMALARLHLCELEIRVGRWTEVDRILEDWAATTDAELLQWPMYERCRALLAAGRGDTADARRWGEHAVLLAEENGGQWDLLEARRALGLAALLDHDLATAVRHLGEVREHAEDHGILDPGVFPVAPDLVEALVESGLLDEAERLVTELGSRAEQQGHPWARATAARGHALVRGARGSYDDDVATALADATTAYDRLGLVFDAARTRLTHGRLLRRARKWGAARSLLTEATTAFEAAGATGWAAAARADLERVGARRPTAAGTLSKAEQRVAELAAQGLSNKEIARALSVSVHTVEFHLGHVYGKLGLRSRVQLAAHFLG